MTDDNKKEGSLKRRKTDHQRLESWKAIANYLQRSVRTVRRWESDEGLPVHRHKHSKGSSVYAYCSELDAWRNSNRKSLASPPAQPAVSASSAPPKRTRPALGAYVLVAFVAAVAGTFAGKFIFEGESAGTSFVSEENTLILFTEPTIDDEYSELGLDLNQALARSIGSRYRDLPWNRIESALKLMRQDANRPLEIDVATEVALRDGEVNAVITPRLEQVAGAYVLSAQVYDPHNDRLIGYPSETARGAQAVLPAIERLGDSIRAALSSLPTDAGLPRLDRVTTSSLQALRLYSRAVLCLDGDRPGVALELLDLALEQDPEFASARILQALALKQQGASPEHYLRASAEAVSLASRASAAERYYIEASHHFLSGDLNRAEVNYRALLEIDAENARGAQALLDICLGAGRPDNCTDSWARLADLQPERVDSNLRAAKSIAMRGTDPERAALYANRARTLWRQDPSRVPPNDVAEILVFPVLNAWSNGDLDVAFEESRLAKTELPALPSNARDATIRRLFDVAVIFGRIDEAADLIDTVSDSGLRHELRAVLLLASGDMEQLARYLASSADFDAATRALLMAMSGLPDRAIQLQERLRTAGMSQASAAVIRGRVALNSGDVEFAQSELYGVIEDLSPEDREFYFVGLDTLAEALNADGRLDEAVRFLERTSQVRNDAVFNETGLYWLMCQRQLARLYRDAGRVHDAAAIESVLRDLLTLADRDFFLRVSLERA